VWRVIRSPFDARIEHSKIGFSMASLSKRRRVYFDGKSDLGFEAVDVSCTIAEEDGCRRVLCHGNPDLGHRIPNRDF
ncbi:hypothetical protein GWI33_011332, partial [Rhynchophorus ferrugineus]